MCNGSLLKSVSTVDRLSNVLCKHSDRNICYSNRIKIEINLSLIDISRNLILLIDKSFHGHELVSHSIEN